MFEPGLEPEQAAQLAAGGVFHVVPIGHRRDEIFGLRIIPGVALAESPVVRVVDHQVQTIVARPSSFVSWLLHPGTVVSAEAWRTARDHPAATWRELERLDAAFGGAGLDAIRALLDDDAIRDGHLFSAPPARFYAAALEVHRRIDPAPESQRYWSYLATIALTDAFEPPPDGLGCWAAAAWNAAYAMAEGGDADPEAWQWAWPFWCGPHGLDCFQRDVPSLVTRPDGETEAWQRAARRLVASDVPRAWRDDPRWAAAADLAREPARYGGLAHIEAARALARAGRAHEAFDALISAAYWLAERDRGGERVQLAEAAQLLAREAGWAETLAALELAAARVNAAQG